jgi:hypothetical protein
MKSISIYNISVYIICTLIGGWILSGCGKASITEVEKNIFVNYQSLDLFVNDEVKITASPTGEAFSWESENTSVAIVDASGLVRAAGEGETNIMVSYGNVKRVIPVSVVVKIPATGIIVSKTGLELKPKENITVTVSLLPENSNDKAVLLWRSANPGIVKVTEGIVEAVKEGITSIFVKLDGSATAEVEIPVEVSYTFPFNGPHILSSATPCQIQARDFDTGGQNYGFYDTGTTAGSPDYRPELTGNRPCVEGGTHIGYVAANEWLQFTVDVQNAGTYLVDCELAIGGGSQGTFQIKTDGVAEPETIVPPSQSGDGWSIFVWLSERSPDTQLPIINLTEGRHKIIFYMGSPNYNFRALKFIRQ